jgi:hypothetical protein
MAIPRGNKDLFGIYLTLNIQQSGLVGRLVLTQIPQIFPSDASFTPEEGMSNLEKRNTCQY